MHTSLKCPPIVNKLPPPETARWGAVRKATVVRGVQAGLFGSPGGLRAVPYQR